MSHARPGLTTCSQYDAALHALSAARQRWAETSVNRRLALLRQIKDALAGIAPAWVAAAAAAKGLPAGDPLAGEEWLAGPCALMVGCNGLIATLEQLEEKTFLRRIPLRTLADGRLALRVVFNSALGLLALWILERTAPVTGLTLGVNWFNALTVGVLGLPGLGLLLLVKWVLV